MNDMMTFNNPEFGNVRTLTIDNEPWFVGKDVAKALGYEKATDAVRKHTDSEDQGISKMETPSGVQEMVIINESGLYSLIFSSKLESAKKFKRWVTSEVLPSIRKTGSYSMTCTPPVSPGGFARLIAEARKTIADMGGSPQDIGEMMRVYSQAWNIPVPQALPKLIAGQQSLFSPQLRLTEG